MYNLIAKLMGANPYRSKKSPVEFIARIGQFALATGEFALVTYVPWYRNKIRAGLSIAPDLMIVGAQKSGTTWVHAEFEKRAMAAVSPLKECHHFDRGRMWTLRNYFAQYDQLNRDLPCVEVAPDYGPMSKWRIRTIKAILPDMKVAFIARNPVSRAWSGTRMETAFDRGWKLENVSVLELVSHLKIKRSRKYGNYGDQIGNWSDVFGADNIKVLPYEQLENDPESILKELIEHAGGEMVFAEKTEAGRVFQGENATPPLAACHALKSIYGPQIDRFEAALGPAAKTQSWQQILGDWRAETEAIAPKPESERKLLYVCGFQPNPKATSSGQKLAYSKIESLAKQFESLEVLYFVNEIDKLDAVEIEWPDNVTVLPPMPITKQDRILGLLRWPLLPNFVAARKWAARKVMSEKLNDPTMTDFYADFAQGIAAFPDAAYDICVFRQHDIVSKLYARQSDHASGVRALLYKVENVRALRWENRVWGSAMDMRSLTHEDASTIKSRKPQANVTAEVVRGTVIIKDGLRSAQSIVKGRIGYWGNMARHENVDAAIHMVNDLLPEIRKQCPQAHFWIIGAHPTDEVMQLEDAHVHVTGFVDDPSEIFASLEIAVAPVRVGSGVKIKVFETIDAGIPTVVSPVASEGIEDHPHMHRATTDAELIDSVVALLTQDDSAA